MPKPDFRLVRPDELLSMPNHRQKEPNSLVVPVLKRFPFQPEMYSENPKLSRSILLRQLRKDLGVLKMTDWEFHRISHAIADAIYGKKRVAQVIQEVRDDNYRHEELSVQAELMRRAAFYKKVHEIWAAQEHIHVKARRFQLAAFQFLRKNTLGHAVKQHDHLLHLIHKAAVNADHWQHWRFDDLFAETGSHGYSRLKGHGQKREEVVGAIHWQLARLISEMHRHWRLGAMMVTLPNGGLTHVHGQKGKPMETVTFELNLPLVIARTKHHSTWHDYNFQVATPNHSLMHAKKQGRQPERATAQLWLPTVYHRTLTFNAWHDRRFLIQTANHSLMHATKQGQTSEFEHAAVALPLVRERTARDKAWHLSHEMALTPNKGIAPLAGHGRTIESVAATAADIPRKRHTEGLQLSHEARKFIETPNGAIGQLKFVGMPHGQIAGNVAHQERAKVTATILEDRLSNLFVPTENGTWRRLGRDGKSVEHVSADVVEQDRESREANAAKDEEQRVFKARKAVLHFQKALAAHEAQASLLHGHVVQAKVAEPDRPPPAHASKPLPEPSPAKAATASTDTPRGPSKKAS